jgi:hypothetical protein
MNNPAESILCLFFCQITVATFSVCGYTENNQKTIVSLWGKERFHERVQRL